MTDAFAPNAPLPPIGVAAQGGAPQLAAAFATAHTVEAAAPVASAPTPALPPFAEQVVGLVSRHGLTAIAGFLLAHGILQQGQDATLVNLLLPVAVFAAGVAWSYIQKAGAQRTFKAALLTPAPTVH